MNKDWGFDQGDATFASWPRSFEQNIKTRYGTVYSMTASMEIVEKFHKQSGEIVETHKGIGDFVFQKDQLTGEDLTDANIIEEAMTRLIGRRYSQWKLEQESLPAEE